MKIVAAFFLGFISLSSAVLAEELDSFQTLYDERSVDTQTLSIRLDMIDEDVRFSVTLHDKETGFERRHEFDGEGSNDVTPYQLHGGYYCDTSVILLTVEYPWRHDLPQYVRVLDTYAFRASDFEFIDVAFGPLSDIALQDSTYPEELDPDMLPPVGVQCLSEQDGKPFAFVERAIK